VVARLWQRSPKCVDFLLRTRKGLGYRGFMVEGWDTGSGERWFDGRRNVEVNNHSPPNNPKLCMSEDAM
jgi:hypothetical protein